MVSQLEAVGIDRIIEIINELQVINSIAEIVGCY